MHHLRLAALLLLWIAGSTIAHTQAAAEAPPALEAIVEADLERDLYEFASDSMRGREAGTVDEFRAAAWLAIRAAEAGLEPAGQDGTFFQFFDLLRHGVTGESTFHVGSRQLVLSEDVVAATAAPASLEAPLREVGEGVDVSGSAAIIRTSPPTELTGVRPDMDAMQHFVNEAMAQLPIVIMSGAAAVIAVPDSVTAQWFTELAHVIGRDSYSLDGAGPAMQVPVPILMVHPEALEGLNDEATLRLEIVTSASRYPSVNVVARAPGTDLSDQYVLFSAHLDHDGIAEVDGEERIWNGADDNGSGSVALLAIGRAFADQPARRSALFVWHGAEEKGLLGSRHYSASPTVDRDGIVAVLNADMIGRNHPDTTALLGVRPGNRNSRDLAEAALTANDLTAQFVIDPSWDEPDHPERFWQRSDHFPYAMAGFPALFFSTGLHPQYHTPEDTPDLIDYAKLTQMARWIYATGWIVANRDQPPALD